jgi:hypothetical protein
MANHLALAGLPSAHFDPDRVAAIDLADLLGRHGS